MANCNQPVGLPEQAPDGGHNPQNQPTRDNAGQRIDQQGCEHSQDAADGRQGFRGMGNRVDEIV